MATKTQRITPKPGCQTCGGTGTVTPTVKPGGIALPYFCKCVYDQMESGVGEVYLTK